MRRQGRPSIRSEHIAEAVAGFEQGRRQQASAPLRRGVATNSWSFSSMAALHAAKEDAQDLEFLEKVIALAKANFILNDVPSIMPLVRDLEELVLATESSQQVFSTDLDSVLEKHGITKGHNVLYKIVMDLHLSELELALEMKDIANVEAAIFKSAPVLLKHPMLKKAKDRVDGFYELEQALQTRDIADVEAAFFKNVAVFTHPMLKEAADLLFKSYECMLRQGMEARNISEIQAAIDKTRGLFAARESMGETTAEANVLFEAVELLVSLHAEELAHAVKSEVACDIAAAIQKSKDILMGRQELLEAQVLLTKLQLQDCRENVSKELANKGVRRSSLMSLRTLLQTGKSLSSHLESGLMASMEELERDAQLQCNWTCGVCMEESDEAEAFPPSCCGRDGSSNLLCQICRDALIKRGAKCPFCRGPTSAI